MAKHDGVVQRSHLHIHILHTRVEESESLHASPRIRQHLGIQVELLGPLDLGCDLHLQLSQLLGLRHSSRSSLLRLKESQVRSMVTELARAYCSLGSVENLSDNAVVSVLSASNRTLKLSAMSNQSLRGDVQGRATVRQAGWDVGTVGQHTAGQLRAVNEGRNLQTNIRLNSSEGLTCSSVRPEASLAWTSPCFPASSLSTAATSRAPAAT